MSAAETEQTTSLLGKRERDSTEDVPDAMSEDDDDIGPMPMPDGGEVTVRKKRKGEHDACLARCSS